MNVSFHHLVALFRAERRTRSQKRCSYPPAPPILRVPHPLFLFNDDGALVDWLFPPAHAPNRSSAIRCSSAGLRVSRTKKRCAQGPSRRRDASGTRLTRAESIQPDSTPALIGDLAHPEAPIVPVRSSWFRAPLPRPLSLTPRCPALRGSEAGAGAVGIGIRIAIRTGRAHGHRRTRGE
jgi:hypothetical protein